MILEGFCSTNKWYVTRLSSIRTIKVSDMSWSTRGVYDQTKAKSKRHSDVALTCYVKTKPSPKLNESMPNNYDQEELKLKLPDSAAKARKDIKKKGFDLMAGVKAELGKQEEKHRVQLVEQEEKWKTRVKQVLHNSHEKLTGAEEKLQHQMEENEGLARSNSRLKENVESMKEKQAIFQEIRALGKDLKSLRNQVARHEDTMIETKRVNEQLSTGLNKIFEDKYLMNALVVHMAETDRRANGLNIELDQMQTVLDHYKDHAQRTGAENVKWQKICLIESLIAVASLSCMAVLFWRRWKS